MKNPEITTITNNRIRNRILKSKRKPRKKMKRIRQSQSATKQEDKLIMKEIKNVNNQVDLSNSSNNKLKKRILMITELYKVTMMRKKELKTKKDLKRKLLLEKVNLGIVDQVTLEVELNQDKREKIIKRILLTIKTTLKWISTTHTKLRTMTTMIMITNTSKKRKKKKLKIIRH